MSISSPARTLAILEAGPIGPDLVNRHGSQSAFFRAWLGPIAPNFDFASYRVYLDQLPESPTAHDAFLVTGSSHGVYDPLPWIDRLKSFVRAAAEVRPVVGICFGHQLVAEAFGGRVEKAVQGWGIGVHRYRRTSASDASWMTPRRDEIALIASHQDQVVVPPPGAQILAGSTFCPVGMMTVGANVLSMQAHPEMTPVYSRELYEGRRTRIGSSLIDVAIDSLATPTDARSMAEWILAFIEERTPKRATSMTDAGTLSGTEK